MTDMQKSDEKWLKAITQEKGENLFNGETDLYHGTQTLYLTDKGLRKLIQNILIESENMTNQAITMEIPKKLIIGETENTVKIQIPDGKSFALGMLAELANDDPTKKTRIDMGGN